MKLGDAALKVQALFDAKAEALNRGIQVFGPEPTTVKLGEVLTWKTENFTLGVKRAKVFLTPDLAF